MAAHYRTGDQLSTMSGILTVAYFDPRSEQIVFCGWPTSSARADLVRPHHFATDGEFLALYDELQAAGGRLADRSRAFHGADAERLRSAA